MTKLPSPPAMRRRPTKRPPATQQTVQEVLGSVHTTNFPDLLRQLGCLVVSTYQAGKLVMLRPDGDTSTRTSARFRGRWAWPRTASRLGVGTHRRRSGSSATCRPSPAASSRPATTTRASCRAVHVTGDIQIHEMASAPTTSCGSSTRGSPACARSTRAQLRAALAAAVRLAARAGGPLPPQRPRDGRRPAALRHRAGRDERRAQGWRANKRDGGVLIDVASGEVVARGLSMPHSPRWYAAGCGCSSPGAARSSTRRPATRPSTRRSRRCRASRAASTSSGRSRSSACRRCASRTPFSGIPITDEQPRARERRLGGGHRAPGRRSRS